MGGYTTTTSSTTSTSGSSSCFPLQHHQEGHVSSSSSSSSLTVASHRAGQTQMPFSSYYSAQPSGAHVREERGEESGAGSGCPAVAVSGAEGYDCESEEGVEVLEEPVKPAPPRSSGSKRSRAAEVHNLSEKRRRSRINEKMKALQNLIPNSNKTDKASMLDEAIEYLKQLQLQVQMLSMRNGLNLHPMYFSGAMQPLQAPQISMGYGVNNEAVMNMNAGMLTLNQETSALNSFASPNPCTPSHQSILPNLTNISNSEPSFRIESSQPHSGSFQLTVPTEGIFSEDLASQQQLDRGDITKSLQENKAKSMALTASMPFGGQESLLDADHLEICMLGKERSQDMLTKDPEHLIFVQDLHGWLEEVSHVVM